MGELRLLNMAAVNAPGCPAAANEEVQAMVDRLDA